MSDVIYINEEEGKKRVNNNGAFYARLLTKFNADKYLSDIETFAAAKDWINAQTAVHTLKGVAANLSLTELWTQSLDVETQLKGQSLNSESLQKLKVCYQETLTAVGKVIAKYA